MQKMLWCAQKLVWIMYVVLVNHHHNMCMKIHSFCKYILLYYIIIIIILLYIHLKLRVTFTALFLFRAFNSASSENNLPIIILNVNILSRRLAPIKGKCYGGGGGCKCQPWKWFFKYFKLLWNFIHFPFNMHDARTLRTCAHTHKHLNRPKSKIEDAGTTRLTNDKCSEVICLPFLDYKKGQNK